MARPTVALELTCFGSSRAKFNQKIFCCFCVSGGGHVGQIRE